MNKSKKKQVILRLTTLALLVLLMIAGTVGLYIRHQFAPINPGDQTLIEVRVPENSTAHSVAALLKQNGLIRSERLFLFYCYQQGWETDLKAGLYDLGRHQSLPELAQQIAAGKVKQSTFTVPEGYTVRQIGDLLVNKSICTQAQWDEALHSSYDYSFLSPEITDPEKRLEGYLFPDTYKIEEQTGAKQIVDMMLARFAGVWEQEFSIQAEAKQMDLVQVIKVASLIEKEAKVAGERKRIAGVIYNRLRAGMPLQLCASVIYSLGVHRDTVTYEDLEVDSPYNTYKYAGLPPGPIACPGKASIDAALNPEVNNYYYFVATGDGSHQFSVTYAEHLAAVQKYGQ